jgi:hypothetical protein
MSGGRSSPLTPGSASGEPRGQSAAEDGSGGQRAEPRGRDPAHRAAAKRGACGADAEDASHRDVGRGDRESQVGGA